MGVNGSAAGKTAADHNELQRLFTAPTRTPDTYMPENSLVSYAPNDTQLSTIPLDEFSSEREAETRFQEPPPASAAGRQDHG
jgi:hypothetical protein